MAGESRFSPRRIDAADRQRQAVELRKAGASFRQIADQLGYSSTGGAFKAVEAALRKTMQEAAETVRTLELERLDAMTLALWPQAQQGNLSAVDRMLRIMERRARLLGLDAAVKADLTSGGEPLALRIEVVYRDHDDSDVNPAP